MDILELTREYEDEIVAVFIEAFNREPWNDRWTEESAKEHFRRILDGGDSYGLIGIENGKVIAFIVGNREYWYTGEAFQIREFCVRSGIRGSGCGTFLLAELEKRLKGMGVKSVFLLTSRNSRAEAFYAKHRYSRREEVSAMGKSLD